ncbi:MAG: hypothetical protein HYV18_09845, partial [Gammaproteobacteria bacterium]|nr:hypothetical protein [Gammaproteobacteria bacterium]
MFARNVFRALLLCGVALVSACGGETVSGEAATGDDDPGSSTKAAPASIILSSSSSQLPADADTQAEGVTLAAIVLDAGGRTIEDVDVTFARTGCGAIIV